MIYRVKTQTAAAGQVDSVSPYFMPLNFRKIIDSGVEGAGREKNIDNLLESSYCRDERDTGLWWPPMQAPHLRFWMSTVELSVQR